AGAGVIGSVAVHAAAPASAQLDAAQTPVPAVVAERATGPNRTRMIELRPEPNGTTAPAGHGVSYDLVGAEPTPWLRDRTRDLLGADGAADTLAGRADRDPVAAVVSALVDSPESSLADPEPVQRALSDLAVGYITVEAPQTHPLFARIDRLPMSTRVSSTQGGGLWRVGPSAGGARVWAESGSGQRLEVPIDDEVTRARVELPPESAYLVVSEPAAWARVAQVRLDGALLEPEAGFPVRYAVPPGGGSLAIEVPMADQQWWWAAASLALVSTFFALPVIGSAQRRGR
ncbi:MAG: hypothetical protein WA962_14640, partial [Ornithinimicrobium sp.]